MGSNAVKLRRDWLFANAPNGARASGDIYRLIETAKANGHEPYPCPRHIVTELPTASGPEEVAALLPVDISPKDIADPRQVKGRFVDRFGMSRFASRATHGALFSRQPPGPAR